MICVCSTSPLDPRVKRGSGGDNIHGLCLFLCPTCPYYSVQDRASAHGDARRVRQRDVCYVHGFTRISGGLDQMSANKDMVPRRYRHRLVRQVEEYGVRGRAGRRRSYIGGKYACTDSPVFRRSQVKRMAIPRGQAQKTQAPPQPPKSKPSPFHQSVSISKPRARVFSRSLSPCIS